jgi:hypothetical protein
MSSLNTADTAVVILTPVAPFTGETDITPGTVCENEKVNDTRAKNRRIKFFRPFR